MQQQLIFDADLIKRYDKAGPRYTSYPTAVQFHTGFDATAYRTEALRSHNADTPLSLYFHIPFCDTVCFYCACNKVVTKDRSRAAPYLARVYQEMMLQSQLFSRDRQVSQLHWGGGTPTFLSHEEMRTLMAKTREFFNLCDDDSGEYSIEIDPREVQNDTISLLRELGFNRMSLGVQDFEPTVQQAVNRLQTEAETFTVLDAARREGFKSISIDLIYGLPHQTVDTFARTLDKIIAVQPDRLSVFNYAHLPTLFKPQRRINTEELPSPADKLAILQTTINRLTDAGYVYIGMDHFARPDDELAIAQRNGTLYRNFQGYATQADCDLIGLGITSIGKVGDSYSQNVKTLEEYYALIDAGQLAVFRGVALETDDKLRREIITQLMCHFSLSIALIENAFQIDFQDYFATEWQALASLQADGLIEYNAEKITILPAGRLLVRNICMTFDKYLRLATEQRFSKVI
ncbi:oxygen-independent coproporphyrinogen III oxidase [Beggiatoa leptomitoformis]|uniref:Coproporphyrinogen-III oxidase n=1 Tax=Beggiatoa leptomitoformis TaxID=288004 RepID=A0A2N9YGD8_9GAMM|nr:oxygen-independent coproporphyrinogen III oxidase [Beggiatoa leptomitoformis]ALG68397.1 oxygen-independent coproporphyrinogen III oxidase [Beggiatoa leptomitoformis]AUI69276.1 oxygen-independent coproporphyrinogen III oxidase [Beggiatoa leptomitoformis]